MELYRPLTFKEKIARAWGRFVWPYASFKAVYRQASGYRRNVLILNFLFPGLGDVLLGDVEIGLGYLSLSALYVFYMFTVGWKQLIGVNAVSYLNLSLLAIFISLLFLGIYHLSIRDAVRKVDRKTSGKPTHGSYVAHLVGSIIFKISAFNRQFRALWQKADRHEKIRYVSAFFFLGVDEMIDRQWFKGILLFLAEIGFICYMILAGAGHLAGLVTLHVQNQISTASMVYGILAVILIAFYFVLYLFHLRFVRENGELRAAHQPVPGFREEWKGLSNRKFYVVALFIPIAGAVAFTVLPLVFMILIAFTDFGTSGTIPITNVKWINWTFLDSFRQLFGLSQNIKALVNVFSWTMIWAFLATFTCYFGGFFLAMLLAKKSVKPKLVYRSLFVVAMAVPQFVSLRVMNAMFNTYGPINTLLLQWGVISQRIDFWNNVAIAKTLIITVNMWVGIPYYMLLISGLLLNIPKDYYEAASIEGANKAQQFGKITFPHIFFMTSPLLITSFVSNINNFNVIWLLTGGEPLGQGTGGVAGATDILITWLYKLTMQNNPEYNLGAAIGILMFVISAVISILIFRHSDAYKREEEFRQ